MPWRESESSGILAIHAALLPTGSGGEVLLFGGDEHWDHQSEKPPMPTDPAATGFRKVRIFDVASNSLVPETVFGLPEHAPASDVFCSGHAFIADGRLLIAGGTLAFSAAHGHDLDFEGHRRCWVFNPRARRWDEVAQLEPEPGKEVGGGRWYPGVVTLANGDVAAFFGHTSHDDSRHRSVRPERYSAATNAWTYFGVDMAAPSLPPNVGGVRFLNYPRVYQVPDGTLFFATPMPVLANNVHHSTRFDVATGQYTGTPIEEPRDGMYGDWNTSSVLLPLLPNEGYRARVLFCGAARAFTIDLGGTAAWELVETRPDGEPVRTHGVAVLLPTASVLMLGGVQVVNPEVPVLHPELFSPGIDWATGRYTAPIGWSANRDDDATLTRNYHSIAILMPDGRVLTAGGNVNGGPGNPATAGIREIEVYEPEYIPRPGQPDERPEILGAPSSITWGQTFDVQTSSNAIERAALIRCGSVTHAWNLDQRYVGLTFTADAADPTRLRMTAPPNGNVAPPGYYMLWVVNSEDKPARAAKFVRLCDQTCSITTDRDTFSVDEVGTDAARFPVTFENALYVQFERFLPTELPAGQPVPSLTFEGNPVPGVVITPRPGSRDEISDPTLSDRPRRIVFTYDVRFENAEAFNGLTAGAQRVLNLRMTLDHHVCSANLRLIREPNPFILDGDPPWLSTDVRVFSLLEGEPLSVLPSVGPVQSAEDAVRFITDLLTGFNNQADTAAPGMHPFDRLDRDRTQLEISRSLGTVRVYNFAIARVHYRGQTVPADDVRVFFRLFTTLSSGVEFERARKYRRHEEGANAAPLLGVGDANEVISIPFFASPRVPTEGATGSSMRTQQDPGNVVDFAPLSSEQLERTRYYGCWLDFNQMVPRFPLALPADLSDGPYENAMPILDMLRGPHQCLIAEVLAAVGSDLITIGQGPSQSDKLAQRNLAIEGVPNPGGPETRTIQAPFDLKLSRAPNIIG